MTNFANMEEAVAHGLHHLTLYQTATGAWDCTARHKTKTVIGHAVLRTPEAAIGRALADFVAKMNPAPTEDIFG